MVEEAEGLKLHLAPGSKTGYKGVYQQSSGRYSAKWWDVPAQKYRPLGSFDTAVEAAVAFRRAVGPPGGGGGGDDDDDDDDADEPQVVEEAEGVKLHLAPGSKTGYKGVAQNVNGARYSAKCGTRRREAPLSRLVRHGGGGGGGVRAGRRPPRGRRRRPRRMTPPVTRSTASRRSRRGSTGSAKRRAATAGCGW